MASTRPVDWFCACSISLRRSSSSSARIACAIASSAPRRPERAMTMAITSSSTSAPAPKPIRASPTQIRRAATIKRISFIQPLEPVRAPARVFINPEIGSSAEDLSVYGEGCLSIPEYYEEVERRAQVRIRFTDLDGKVHEEDADGLFATCIQREIDHLNGVLFVDYLSKLKRDRVLKKFTKAAKRAGE